MITSALAEDYDVVAAIDCVAALGRIANGERYDAILCELTMPGMGGIDLHRELGRFAREQRRRMVFLVEGVSSGPDSRDLPVLDHLDNLRLAKPFSLPELRSVVQERLYAPLA